ncbi:uncharacterized protein FIBRA_06430 [Fibroporia radiculosa]|uniref:NAD-dependent epimerase/dehydratase domain-containing protein n=1 Tax=Fibroporia radiculosa TaxID=599839 RepID=J4IB93_9APHY|nr:uncharacterized protein FIBRA_06430 [Fibroporia radiculosa]CCM04261.1 predicted protein [Fibroporia radiculosa]
MPAVTTGKVLVTGANGYVAVWVVRTLLEQGYVVRGAVRSESKAAHLRTVFASYGDKLELLVAGAFDEAVKGVDAIEHTASPYHFKAGDPDELIVPALHGTTRVLESALAYGTAVKRVVITSSVAAVMRIEEQPLTLSEADWNDQAIVEVREKGRGSSQAAKYRASKTLAERAAWEFVEKNKGAIGWDLVVLNPPFVYGPALHEVDKPEALNESMHSWFHSVLKNLHDPKQLGVIGGEWIDVRDLAQGHVLAIQKEEAGGERFVVTQGPWKWQDWINAASEYGVTTSTGDDSYDPAKATQPIRYDASKASRVLGIKYHSIKETTRDILDDLKSRKWI